MKESTPLSENSHSVDCLISQSYIDFHVAIYNYIKNRINNAEDAADIAQDTFVRLLEHKQMLRTETIKSYIFTIARNLLVDYQRLQFRKVEVSANMMEFSKEFQDTNESRIYAEELLLLEKKMIMQMPRQRKKVYMLDRFEEKTAFEIALELNISKRTVENLLLTGRKQVRQYIQNCV